MPITMPLSSTDADDVVIGSHHHHISDLVDVERYHSSNSNSNSNTDSTDTDSSDSPAPTSLRLELDDVPLTTDNSTSTTTNNTTAAAAANILPSSPLPPSHVEIAFSSSAGMFTYQMGVAAYIQDHFDVSSCRFSGCSGGSWAATLLAADTSVHKAWQVILAAQRRIIPPNHAWYSGYGRYARIVGATIQELWADDPMVFARVSQRHLHIAVTKFPSMQGELHNAWTSLDDLMHSILASSLVPFAVSGRLYLEHRGQKYIDGCVSNFKGVNLPPSEYSTLSDVTFHAKKLVVDSARSSLTTLARYVLPTSLHKSLATWIYRALPNLTASHDVIAPLSLRANSNSSTSSSSANATSSGQDDSAAPADASSSSSSFSSSPQRTPPQVHRLLIRPWSFRGPSIWSYHLTVDPATHQQRFDNGYKDAMDNHDEFAALLPPRVWPAAAA